MSKKVNFIGEAGESIRGTKWKGRGTISEFKL